MHRRGSFITSVWRRGSPWWPDTDGVEDLREENTVRGGPKIMVTFHEPNHFIKFERDGRSPPPLTEYQRGRLQQLPCGADEHRLYGVKTGDLEAVVRELVEVLATPDFNLPDTLPEYDIDDAPIPDQWKVTVVTGRHPNAPDKYLGDRSRLVLAVARVMVRNGMTDTEIASVLLDPDYIISAHCRSKGDLARRCVQRVIERVREQTHD